MDYINIDLNANAKKGFADIASYMEGLGNLANNMKAQQKLKLLNHQVILKGLSLVRGLNKNFDEKIELLLKNVNNALEEKKTPYVKIFAIHILVFLILLIGTIVLDPDIYSVGYLLSSVGMGCATGVLNLMLLRERKKYEINNLFFLLEEEEIEKLEPLHKQLASQIDEFKTTNSSNNEELKQILKNTISLSIR